jgi:phosphotriesterase-related protein
MTYQKISTLNRRHFIKTSLTAGCLAASLPISAFLQKEKNIITVNGEIPAQQMGLSLIHEHVMVDFVGADKVSTSRYNREEVFKNVLPHLKQARELGCRTFVECTPAFLARDPLLLKQLADASGLQILTNTGYYGARNDESLPPHAFTETADQLAQRWIKEFKQGIEGTGIRPGFIKIGVDEGKLSDIDRKLMQAAARTHLQTGLTIAVHTGKASGAMDELEVLKTEKVHPSAWIWVHAQAEEDMAFHVKAAKEGGWISLDGIGWDNEGRHIEMVTHLKKQNLLNRVLVSQDAGWYHVGEPNGGKFQPFNRLFTEFLPALKQKGFSQKDINQLLIQNPMEAFTVRVRKA